ncbi:MAG TPA: histidine kinase [Micropruina sp.]|nr:histidine kinase [Micropruina sp.]
MRFLNSNWVEVVLATLLSSLALILDLRGGHMVTLILDLAACAAAATTARWPRAGSAVLAALLAGHLLVPREWSTMGKYAALIPILGTGIRGNRQLRVVISVVYLVILTAVQYHDYPERGALFLFAGLTWGVLFAACWVIGDLFSSLRRNHAASERAALAEQRLTLARDLHDTIARSITRLSLTARLARDSGNPAELDTVIDDIHQIGNELRWVMTVLNDPTQTRLAESSTGSLQSTISGIQASLTKHGFPTTVTLEGDDLAIIPEPIQHALNDVFAEAAANIDRHAKRGRPCAILGQVDAYQAEFLIINEHDPTDATTGTHMGLDGMRQRLHPYSGAIETRQENPRWTLHITVPLPPTRSASSSSMTTSTSEPA